MLLSRQAIAAGTGRLRVRNGHAVCCRQSAKGRRAPRMPVDFSRIDRDKGPIHESAFFGSRPFLIIERSSKHVMS